MTYEEAKKMVCQDWRDLAHAIRAKDRYASHVSEEEKEEMLNKMIQQADDIESGGKYGFTIAQRIHYKMTGECVALLP